MGRSINPEGRRAALEDVAKLELAAGAAGRLANWDYGPKFLDIPGHARLVDAYQSLLVELGQMAPTLPKLSTTRTAQSRSSDRKG